MRPFLTTIIPTIGRATLNRAIESLVAEGWHKNDHEILVVNDSGERLEIGNDGNRLTLVETNRRNYIVARNAGAAMARGRYLHFLDDDDWMISGWLNEFETLANKYPAEVLLYGGCRIMNQDGDSFGEINLGASGNCAAHLMAGSWIQVGTAAIQADRFFQVGGFRPQMLPSEETDLFRRLSLIGDFGNTATVLMSLFRVQGWQSSISYDSAVENLRVSREAVLEADGAWARLRSSSDTPYWRGRNLKAYMASARWNLGSHRWSTVLSRSFYSAATFITAGPAVMKTEFWKALKDTQVPATADRVFQEHRNQSA